MIRRLFRSVVLACAVAAMGCGPSIDLGKSLVVTDVLSGWYDNGLKDGINFIVPSISFRLQNTGTVPLNEVDLLVSVWSNDPATGTACVETKVETNIDERCIEWTSKGVRGIGATAVAPGSTSDPILVRADHGYTLEQPRAEIFTNSHFKDATAKIFAKRSGAFVPIGEFKLDRRLIPHSLIPSSQP